MTIVGDVMNVVRAEAGDSTLVELRLATTSRDAPLARTLEALCCRPPSDDDDEPTADVEMVATAAADAPRLSENDNASSMGDGDDDDAPAAAAARRCAFVASGVAVAHAS